MYLRTMRCVLLSLAFVFGSSTCSLAQWQLIAGYDISGFESQNLNQFLVSFNQSYPATTESFSKMRVLHSLIAGVRYQHDLGGVELTYQRGLARRSVDGIRLTDLSQGQGPVDLFLNTNTISTGMEWGRDFTVGFALDYSLVKYEILEEANLIISDQQDRDESWGCKLFFAWLLSQSERVSFSLRPYYKWIWSDLDFSSVGSAPLDESIRCGPCSDRPKIFGLSILIHNGRKAN